MGSTFGRLLPVVTLVEMINGSKNVPWWKGSFTYYVRKILRKTNISYLLIHTRQCTYYGIRNISFSEFFANALSEWSRRSSSFRIELMEKSASFIAGEIFAKMSVICTWVPFKDNLIRRGDINRNSHKKDMGGGDGRIFPSLFNVHIF